MRRVVAIAAIVVGLGLAIILVTRQRPARSSSTAERHDAHGVTAAPRGSAQADSAAAMRRIAGTVYLEDAPVAGATVRLTARDGGPEVMANTDATGHFDLGAVRVSTYVVVAEVAHATGASLTINLKSTLTQSENIRLVAHACDASLFGVIHDASGGTIAHARVSLGVIGPGVDAGEDGSYEICVPVGDSFLIVGGDGYVDVDARVSAFSRMRRDFDLVPEAVVAGRAVRASDGSPVADATMSLISRDYSAYRRTRHVMSDHDGRFRFHGIRAGRYSLSGTADHLATLEPTEITAEVSSPVDDAVCTLSPAYSISGRVLDKRSKRPVPNQRITANATGHMRFGESNEDGFFTFVNVFPGVYSVGADSFIRDPPTQEDAHEVKLERDDVAGVTIEIDAALGSIAGRVIRAGKGVEGVEVEARPIENSAGSSRRWASSVSDADGRYVLRGLAAGSYRVHAESTRVGAFTNGPTVAIGENEDKTGVDVELNLAGSISGTVIDQAGAPVGGVHVRFSLIQGSDYGQATTAEDGTFKAAALSGGGDYAYEVRPMAESSLIYRPAPGTQFIPISVANGDAHVTGVLIKIQFERLSISGRVVTSDGVGVPDATVTAEPEGHERLWSWPTATTDANGSFIIKDVAAGKYALLARTTVASRHVEAVAAGSKNVDIRLPALGRIDGTLEGFASPPSVEAWNTDDAVSLPPMTYRATLTGSAFSILNVPVGTYSVTAWGKDGRAEAEVVVSSKGTPPLVLKNAGIGSIDGTVVDEAHQPIANASCSSLTGVSTRTSASGAFHLDRVPAGRVTVGCYGDDWETDAEITLERGRAAHVQLIAKKRTPPERGYSGIELGTKDGSLVVRSVAASSPAEHAGVKIGDVLHAIDGVEVSLMDGLAGNQQAIEANPPGTTVKLTIERETKPLTIELTLAARPQPL